MGSGYVIRVIVVFSADCLERRMDERAIAPSQPLTAQVLSAEDAFCESLQRRHVSITAANVEARLFKV